MAKRKRYTENGNSDGEGATDGGSGGDEQDYGNQSLPVAVLPPDFDGIPLDGATYLAMVRQEAATHPAVFTAAHNPYATIAAVPSLPAVSRATELGIPSEEWRDAFLERFKAMREALSLTPSTSLSRNNVARMPKPRSSDAGNKAWFRFIFGRERPTDQNGEMIEVDDDEGPEGEEDAEEKVEAQGGEDEAGSSTARPPLQPTSSLLTRFTTGQILSLLHHLPYWFTIPLERQSVDAPSAHPPAIPSLLSQWCFALLAKLDTRLVSDDISTLRTLARASIAAVAMRRLQLSEQTDDQANEGEDAEQKAEAGAWTVVNIVAGLWGQTDLWESAEEDLGRIPRRQRGAELSSAAGAAKTSE